MSAWMWLNLSLGALFVLAVAGVPLWLVITHPDTGPAFARTADWQRANAPHRAAAFAARRPLRTTAAR